MKTQELRIGNLVKSKLLGTKHKVLGVYKNKIWTDLQESWSDIEDFEPIPLTEECLLKFGFYKTTENAGNLICYKKGKYTIAKWLKNKWQFWINTTDLYNSPQHVHQLQNLYFALTNQELS